MPTGGVNAKNLADYLAFDQIVACGGTLDGEKGPHPTGELGGDHPLEPGGRSHHAGFLSGSCGHQLRQRGEPTRLARTLCDMFGFSYQMGNSSVQALHAVECTKTPGRGTHGHIAIATSNVDRAVYLWACAASAPAGDPQDGSKGNTKAIYIRR